MDKNIGKKMSKSLSGKYSPSMLTMRQKLIDHDKKKPATDDFKTAWKRAIQKIAEATGDLIGNKIANKITGISINPQQYNSEAVANENEKEIPKERYVFFEERDKLLII